MMNNRIDAYASAEILEEYTETVEYLKNKFPGKAPKIPLIGIESKCHVIEVSSKVDICRDPDDPLLNSGGPRAFFIRRIDCVLFYSVLFIKHRFCE